MTALLCLPALPALARRATHSELLGFSREAANASQLGSVEIGSGFIEGERAVASWRSPDGKRRGQALFFYACDHWNLAEVRSGVFSESYLLSLPRVQPMTPRMAASLHAHSIALQHTHTGYLPASHRTPSC